MKSARAEVGGALPLGVFLAARWSSFSGELAATLRGFFGLAPYTPLLGEPPFPLRCALAIPALTLA